MDGAQRGVETSDLADPALAGLPVESADLVVVGAGSAGCAFVDAATEGGRDAILLEAGGSDARATIRAPIGYGLLFHDPSANWRFTAEPDAGLMGRADYWPRGKVVGGSSSINAMVYCRGLPQDFDDWAAAGARGWSWADVRPAYEAMERRVDAEGRESGEGPLTVSAIDRDAHPFLAHYFAAAAEIGLPRTDDPNGARPEGVTLYPITARRGRRWSSADAFLRPALRRGGVRLHKKARALRVLFEGRRAVGVLYARPDGSRAIARARGAVVLSAGAVQTPQLLMLSGVGPAEALAEHGIALRLHAPAVGGYMQDHIGINYFYKSRVPTLNGVLRSWPGRVRSALDWLLRGRGPFALGVNQGGGFVRSTPDAPRPDLQLYCNPLSYSVTRTGKRVLLEPDPFPGFITSFNPCRPTSRGRVRLASADPLAAPKIEPNALSTDADAAQVLAGVALLRRLGRAPALRAVVIEPMVADLDAMDDAAALADFRARSGTVYHACGTARMGEDPSTSVIDPRLRVHGFDRLYVVDASAFPSVTSGNTNAPTMMLARRAGGFLRDDLAKG